MLSCQRDDTLRRSLSISVRPQYVRLSLIATIMTITLSLARPSARRSHVVLSGYSFNRVHTCQGIELARLYWYYHIDLSFGICNHPDNIVNNVYHKSCGRSTTCCILSRQRYIPWFNFNDKNVREGRGS